MPGLLDTQMNPASFGANNLFGASMARQQAERAQVNNDINQQGALQDLFQNEQMNPLKVRQEQLRNQGLEAGLPGITADSDLRTQAAEKGKQTLATDIEEHINKNYNNITKQDAEGMTAFGQQLKQMVEAANQGVSLAQMSGLPDNIRQQIVTPEGRERLGKMADGILRGASGVQAKLAEAEAKATGLQQLEELRQRGRMELQQIRGQVQRQIAEAKQNNDPKTLEAIYSGLINKANNATDQETRNEYLALAQSAINVKDALNINAGQASKVGGLTIDPKVGNLETRPAPVTPTITLPPVNGTANRPDRQATPGVPQGAVDYLKANPTLTKEFDAKYGEGAAAKILSGK